MPKKVPAKARKLKMAMMKGDLAVKESIDHPSKNHLDGEAKAITLDVTNAVAVVLPSLIRDERRANDAQPEDLEAAPAVEVTSIKNQTAVATIEIAEGAGAEVDHPARKTLPRKNRNVKTPFSET